MLDWRLLFCLGVWGRLGTLKRDGPRLGRQQGWELQLLRPHEGAKQTGLGGNTLLPLLCQHEVVPG